MSRSDDIVAAQHMLWHMVEMLLNSTLMTPSRRRQFDILADECLNRFRQAQADISIPIGNRLEVLSRLYQSFLVSERLIEGEGKETTVVFKQLIESSNCTSEVRAFLSDLHSIVQKKLAPFICGAFIHGSIATGDSTGFSDVDAAIIVKDDVMVNARKLKELKDSIVKVLRIMMKFDALQHHGLFIIPESFLRHYSEDYLPVEVLKKAKTLSGPLDVRITFSHQPELARKKILDMAAVFSQARTKHPGTVYELKHILSCFMLLPTLYLQTKGTYIYKRDSFERARDVFGDHWRVMEKVSNLRQTWQRPRSHLFSTLVNVLPNPWYASLLYRKLNWKIPGCLLDEMTDKVYSQMAQTIVDLGYR